MSTHSVLAWNPDWITFHGPKTLWVELYQLLINVPEICCISISQLWQPSLQFSLLQVHQTSSTPKKSAEYLNVFSPLFHLPVELLSFVGKQSIQQLMMYATQVRCCTSKTITLWRHCSPWLCSVTFGREYANSKKSSAVAEMGDRLATIDMGRKVGGVVLLFGEGSWVPI